MGGSLISTICRLFVELRHVKRIASSLLRLPPRRPAGCRMTSKPRLSSVTVEAERHLVKRRRSSRVYRRPHHTRLADVFSRVTI